jgi:predicted transcriptional regulator
MAVTTIRQQADLEEPLKSAEERQRRNKYWIVNQAVTEYQQHTAFELRR